MEFALQETLVEICETTEAHQERCKEKQERDDRWGGSSA